MAERIQLKQINWVGGLRGAFLDFSKLREIGKPIWVISGIGGVGSRKGWLRGHLRRPFSLWTEELGAALNPPPPHSGAIPNLAISNGLKHLSPLSIKIQPETL